MQKIKDNKELMIIKNKINDYYIINKTEKKIILNTTDSDYLILQPHKAQKIREDVMKCIK